MVARARKAGIEVIEPAHDGHPDEPGAGGEDVSDIVKKLRDVAAMDIRVSFLAHTMDTAKEAADEIERLQRENAFLLHRWKQSRSQSSRSARSWRNMVPIKPIRSQP
jgi:hypothetical protein